MNTLHTPGPWAYIKPGGVTVRHPLVYSDNGPVCNATWTGNMGETHANARLLAAAPDLLDALEVLFYEADSFSVSGVYFNEKCMGHKGLDLALAAIAKATGAAS